MTVHFIGAGPGDPELLTIKGQNLISKCPVCLYAGSLIPEAILSHCPKNAKIINTAQLDLDGIISKILEANSRGEDVARLHSGDLSVWSAMGEQIRRIKKEGIKFTVTPGVPSFAAAAAALEVELTLPNLSQSVVLTRLSGRASAVPENEKLENFAKTGSVLALHLSIHRLEEIISKLIPYYGKECPLAIVWRASWPDQKIILSTLDSIEVKKIARIDRTAIIFVGKTIGATDFNESSLYAKTYDRRFRPVGVNPRFPIKDKL